MKRLRYSIRDLLAVMLLVAVVSAGIYYVVHVVRTVSLAEVPGAPGKEFPEVVLEMRYEIFRAVIREGGGLACDPELYPLVVERCLDLLWEGDTEERCNMVFMLGALSEYDARLTPYIQDALNDEDPDVQESARYMLDRLK